MLFSLDVQSHPSVQSHPKIYGILQWFTTNLIFIIHVYAGRMAMYMYGMIFFFDSSEKNLNMFYDP